MIRIEPITVSNRAVFRSVRLRALKEDPSAFGSTYAREAAFDDDEWARRVVRWSGEQGIGFLAIHEDRACGIAGALLEESDQAQLVSMWTAPEYRQHGVGRLLVEAITAWAVGRGLNMLRLMVVSENQSALSFYERLGFIRTGRSEPYPNNVALEQWEMARPLN